MSGEERKAQIKAEFIKNRGYWSPGWDPLLDIAPDYFEAYSKLSSVPWKTGHLTPKVKELLYVAIDASTTHMYEPGLRVHIRNALRYGATRDEIMEVYQLTSVLGVHTITMGVPILADIMKAQGKPVGSGALSPRQEKLKADFIANRGYWSELWDSVLALSPDYFEAYGEFSSVPWKVGTLEPKVREFVYIAIDAATTHLYEPGTKIHMENALRHGATPDEIMEVLALTSVLGIHTVSMGLPVLLDELKKAEQR
ncbi:MAG: carboxymuconolactone decarboxylase family protein [Acetobacteraceae bacterium]|nr:carboxymuconolactone decarboxylase family protein [Pseudomonadota bacterium]